MAKRGLTPEHFNTLAMVMRLGLGLFLLGNAWVFYGLYSEPVLTTSALMDAYGLHGGVADFFARNLFEGEGVVDPRLFAGLAGAVQGIGGLMLLAGFYSRAVGLFFAVAVAIVWIVHFTDATPFVLGEGDSETLRGPISHLRQLALAILFRVTANVGSGSFSLDKKLARASNNAKGRSWNTIAMELRFSLAVLILAAAASDTFFDVPVFAVPDFALYAIGAFVFFGIVPKVAGALVLAALGWHAFQSFPDGDTLTILLNEAAFFAAGVVVLRFGAGDTFQPHKKLSNSDKGGS